MEKQSVVSDEQFTREFRWLAATIKTLSREVCLPEAVQLAGLSESASAVLLKNVDKAQWSGRGRKKAVVEAFIWSALITAVFDRGRHGGRWFRRSPLQGSEVCTCTCTGAGGEGLPLPKRGGSEAPPGLGTWSSRCLTHVRPLHHRFQVSAPPTHLLPRTSCMQAVASSPLEMRCHVISTISTL